MNDALDAGLLVAFSWGSGVEASVLTPAVVEAMQQTPRANPAALAGFPLERRCGAASLYVLAREDGTVVSLLVEAEAGPPVEIPTELHRRWFEASTRSGGVLMPAAPADATDDGMRQSYLPGGTALEWGNREPEIAPLTVAELVGICT